ncbi:MAG: UDP-glucose/GDP-mannose dehydrogenase family protein [Thermoproteales archaeon]|nr:UDP-glucose/GDP-mannose dehydrogenase family protein [Thermoproteales archaeon]
MTYKLSIVGLGYVGLSMCAFLSSKGFEIAGIDIDERKIAMLNKGISPVFENRLDILIKKGSSNKLLSFTNDYSKIRDSDIIFITVGTPSRDDGSIDLRCIESASMSIGMVLRTIRNYKLIVVRSTVVPGTTQNVVKEILERESGKRAGRDFGLCMNPEFLREGEALRDLEYPDRIVIGEYDKRSGDVLENFYRSVYSDMNVPIFRTSLSNAEMIKYANNSFLATKISFINTVATICEKVEGCDIVEVARALGLDKRISPRFLRAGLGFGGSCFPKDVKALISFAESYGYSPRLLKAVLDVNEEQPLKVINFCRSVLGNLEGRTISVLGLSFKPGTDDMREAVSVKIIKRLLDEKAIVKAYDPVARDNAKKIFGDSITITNNIEECLKDSECAIIVTEWEDFKHLRPEDFKRYMRKPVVIDGRRMYDPISFINKGIVFKAIGLGDI